VVIFVRMDTRIRKLVGLFILLFVALPTLFSMIWASGSVQGMLSENMLVDAPKEVVRKIPSFIDESFTKAQKPGMIRDENTRKWVEAAGKVETTPNQLIEQLGLYSWMEEEVLNSFEEFNKMLRGENKTRDISINLVPLKEAFASEQFSGYLRDVTGNLPPCSEIQQQIWRQELNSNKIDYLPACNPGRASVDQVIEKINAGNLNIPDRAPLNRGASEFPGFFNSIEAGNFITQILFIIPIILIALGVVIYSPITKSRLQLAGIITAVSGISAYITASIAKNVTSKSITSSPDWVEFSKNSTFSPEFNKFLFERVNDLARPITDQIFDPVITISSVVIILGVVIFGLSYLAERRYLYTPTASKEKDPEISKKEMETKKDTENPKKVRSGKKSKTKKAKLTKKNSR
jgi:hypothetical protein